MQDENQDIMQETLQPDQYNMQPDLNNMQPDRNKMQPDQNSMQAKQNVMPESIIENTCIYTEKALGELYSKILRKKLIIIALVFLAISAAYTKVLFRDELFLRFGVLMGGLWGGLIIYLFFLPKKQAKNIARKSKELYNGYQEDKTVFYEDHLLITSLLSKAELEISYDQMKYIVETKNLYTIYLNVKSVVLLDKHNFIKGSQQDFIHLMQSKNLPIK